MEARSLSGLGTLFSSLEMFSASSESTSAYVLYYETEEHTRMKMCPEQNMKLPGEQSIAFKVLSKFRHFHLYTTAEQGLRGSKPFNSASNCSFQAFISILTVLNCEYTFFNRSVYSARNHKA